jgi:hypothetical protein
MTNKLTASRRSYDICRPHDILQREMTLCLYWNIKPHQIRSSMAEIGHLKVLNLSINFTSGHPTHENKSNPTAIRRQITEIPDILPTVRDFIGVTPLCFKFRAMGLDGA